MKLKGRGWVAVWLVSVLGVLMWVVVRQTASHLAATELREAQGQRSSLEAQRAELLRRIREVGSRAVLVPRAESLGLRLSADSEIIIVHVPARKGR